MVPLLTYEAVEQQKSKMQKLRQLDRAIKATFDLPDQSKAAHRRANLEKQKAEIRATFPKPKIIQHD